MLRKKFGGLDGILENVYLSSGKVEPQVPHHTSADVHSRAGTGQKKHARAGFGLFKS